MISKRDKELSQRIFDKVNANAPIKSHVLMADLSVHFVDATKDELRAAIADLIDRGIIVELKYEGLSANGLLYFPAETRFEFSNNRRVKTWK